MAAAQAMINEDFDAFKVSFIFAITSLLFDERICFLFKLEKI